MAETDITAAKTIIKPGEEPLPLVAGLGHLWIGNVDVSMLGQLLIGSIPGVVAGSLLTHRMSDGAVRPVLAAILLFAGYRLLVA